MSLTLGFCLLHLNIGDKLNYFTTKTCKRETPIPKSQAIKRLDIISNKIANKINQTIQEYSLRDFSRVIMIKSLRPITSSLCSGRYLIYQQ